MGQIVITKVDAETGKPIVLSQATFEVYAAEDIITPDGTVRYAKGQLVDTIQTENGVATSKLLYLGQYVVIETIAPEGYILDTTPYEAALLYDGQIASLMRYMSGGPVVEQPDVETNPDPIQPSNPNMPQQPDATVPDSKNNASLTIPNNRIPDSPKTGDSFPVAALAALGMASVLGLLTLRRRRKK